MAATRPFGRDIIVIGASAGGIQSLIELVRLLPRDLPAAVFVVIHMSRDNPGILPDILNRADGPPAGHAADKEPIRLARIYVAGPDRHLLIRPGLIRLTRGPQENGFRPAVDPLFRTAAQSYGQRVVGVVLSGSLDDGTHGLMIVKKQGGVAIAQDPHEAIIPSMPQSAIRNVEVDHILTVAEMAPLLVQLAQERVIPGGGAMTQEPQPDPAELQPGKLETGSIDRPPSTYTCPECGGALWEISEGNLLRFRCHVGHGYTADGLLLDQSRHLESALWAALRSLDETAALRRQMARRALQGNLLAMAQTYERQAEDAETRAALIRSVLRNGETSEPGSPSIGDAPSVRNKRRSPREA